jgi:hypothetical protein
MVYLTCCGSIFGPTAERRTQSIILPVPETAAKKSLTYLIIGHVSKDQTPEGEQLGGTSVYAGLTAAACGAEVTLVTACAADLDLGYLRAMRIFRQNSPRTTVFENRNLPGGCREQRIDAIAEPIGLKDLPALPALPDVVHLAPIAGEARAELLARYPNSLRCVTLQGLMRIREADGAVRQWIGPDAEEAVRAASAAVFSRDDTGGDFRAAQRLAEQCRCAVVTNGARGCDIFCEGKSRHVPAPDVVETDPTGAGDIFAAVFFLRLQATGDPERAARAAVEIASRSVTRIGLQGIPTAAEISRATR